MDSWPLSLPQVPDQKFVVSIMNGTTDPEDTLSHRRTRTYPDELVEFTFNDFTVAGIQVLRSFYDVVLNQVKPFTAPWLGAAGYDFHYCTFQSGGISIKTSSSRITVTVKLVVSALVPTDDLGNITYGD